MAWIKARRWQRLQNGTMNHESPTQRLDRLLHAGAAPLTRGLSPLRSLTLLAAQTDFSEPGELGLFMYESQVG